MQHALIDVAVLITFVRPTSLHKSALEISRINDLHFLFPFFIA